MPNSRSPASSALAIPRDHVSERHASRHVALRIEEDLDVPHAISGGAPQVRRRELEEVAFGAQHRHCRVVEAEEVLQIMKR